MLGLKPYTFNDSTALPVAGWSSIGLESNSLSDPYLYLHHSHTVIQTMIQIYIVNAEFCSQECFALAIPFKFPSNLALVFFSSPKIGKR